MISSRLNRIVWKEHRLLRGFWLAMFLAVLAGELYALWYAVDQPERGGPPGVLLVGMQLACFYALGCGATSFAGEREAGTDELQRVLPVRSVQLLGGKLLYATVSVVVLCLLTWFAAGTLAWFRWHSWDGFNPNVACLGALKAVELLLWGVLFSLLIDRTLVALSVAAVVTSVVAYPLAWMLSDIPDRERTILYFPSFVGDMATSLPRAIIILAVAASDVLLVRRWYRRSGEGDRTGTLWARIATGRGHRPAERPSKHADFRRLIWQIRLGARWRFGVVLLTYLGLLVVGLIVDGAVPSHGFLALCIPCAGLMGVFVFADDQLQHQFRFFAEQGISAHRVWFTRQCCWFVPLLLILLVATVLEFGRNPTAGRHAWYWREVLNIWGVAIIAYATGQFCSQWIRSRLIAAAATLPIATILTAWCAVMISLGVIPLVTAVPIPFLLAFTTWATADPWIKERTDRAARRRRVLLIGAPITLIMLAAIGYRWLEIPTITPQFPKQSKAPFEPAIDPQLAAQYDEIFDEVNVTWPIVVRESRADWKNAEEIQDIRITPQLEQWLDDHQDIMQAIAEASQNPAFVSHAEHWTRLHQTTLSLQDITLSSARVQQQHGELDKSLTHYMAAYRIGAQTALIHSRSHPQLPVADESWLLHYIRGWAAAEGQTVERIRIALDELNAIWSLPFNREYGVGAAHHHYVKQLALVAAGEWPKSGWVHDLRFYHWLYRLLPWERIRTDRLIAANTQFSLQSLNDWPSSQQSKRPSSWFASERQLDKWRQTTFVPVFITPALSIGRMLGLNVTDRRCTRLVLALQGWRIEHGHLPRSLDELIPEWFDSLPLDPLTGRPFVYDFDGDPVARMIDFYAEFDCPPYFTLPNNTPYLQAIHPARRRGSGKTLIALPK